MAFNGSGTFNRLYSWVNDAINNILIRSDRMDADSNDIASGLTNCICKDGQSTTTARIPLAVGLSVNQGSVGTPSISVIGDTTTGFYQTTIGEIKFASGGVNYATLNASGLTTTALTTTSFTAGSFSVSGTTSLGTGSADYLQVTGSSGAAVLTSVGSDTNIGMSLISKGTSGFSFYTEGGTTQQVSVADTTGATSYLTLSGGPAYSTITINGSDTNANLNLYSKGTGSLLLATNSGATIQFSVLNTASANRYVTVTGSNGGAPTISTSGGALALNSNTGSVTAPTQTAGDNSTNVATTAYVDRGSSGASMVLIATATASSSASIVFSSIPSTYDHYLLKFTGVIPATNAVDCSLQVSEDNGSTYKSTNYSTISYTYHNTANGASGSTTDTKINISGGWVQISTAANHSLNGEVLMIGLGSASLYKNFRSHYTFYDSNSSNFCVGYLGGEYYGDTGAINAIKIYMSSGNIASGKFALYGIRNS